jgi:hypothetical protein
MRIAQPLLFRHDTPGANYHCGQGDDCADDTGANPQPPLAGVWYSTSLRPTTAARPDPVNATPGDPIQRGGIAARAIVATFGFLDATIDKEGRVLVGYDDGCIALAPRNRGQ